MNRTGSSMGCGNVRNDRYNARYCNESDRYDDLDDSSISDPNNDGDINRESIEKHDTINYRPLALNVKSSDPFKSNYKTTPKKINQIIEVG